MHLNFSRNQWNTDDVTYAYSYRFEETPTFVQHDDCVENAKCADAVYGFDNISLLSRRTYSPGTRISTRCAFEDLGAPLIVIADRLTPDSRGVLRYGNYWEIVLYNGGINVWKMTYANSKVTWTLDLSVEFPVTETDIHTLTVDILEKKLVITADERKMMLRVPDLFPAFHLGINACEGYNRFYSMEIESIQT